MGMHERVGMQLPEDIELRSLIYDADRRSQWEGLLSKEEQVRYRSFPSEKRKREFLLGRVALRTLLAERLEVVPNEVLLEVTDEGAVVVEGAPYHVSITHAEDRAVAAVARRRVGVDLERIAERDPNIADFLMHPDECDLLDTLPMNREAAFILCWTLKEATLKALGTGLLRSPKKLRLEIDPEAQRAAIRAWDGSVWQAQFEEQEGFFLSTAYETKGG